MEKGELAEPETNEADSQAVLSQEDGTFTVRNEDLSGPSNEMRTSNIDCGLELDSAQIGTSDKIVEIKDVKYNTLRGNETNMVEESDLDRRIHASENLHCGPHQENMETSNVEVDSYQGEHESAVMNYQNQDEFVNFVGDQYSSDKVDRNRDFEGRSDEGNLDNYAAHDDLDNEMDESRYLESTKMNQSTDKISSGANNMESVVVGTEVVLEGSKNTSNRSLDAEQETQGVVEKPGTLKSFVSTMVRHLSGKRHKVVVGNSNDEVKDASDSPRVSDIKMLPDDDAENKTEHSEVISEETPQPIAMKGRIILYTRLGCQECRVARQFLYMKRLRYVEINVDVYPSRKLELEKISGSTAVPKVFFNEILIGGLSELTALNKSGMLDERIDFLINEAPSFEAPLPPLSGEDDVSTSGAPDEMALIVRKMKESIIVKDRFYKFRRFTNCFLASEAVDFLSGDQYLERQDAVQFARKLAKKLFFQHVLEENVFEDGNYLYRFLDDDPVVASQCHNIPRGITTVKPKPTAEIASRLRLLSYAMFEAYVSEDGCQVDYRSIHGSEEFARYLRTVEELQRVEILSMSREEKLAFYINLYNMMAIHAILIWGHPAGKSERSKLFCDFKYIIGGSTYSLSDIQNGILRGNQRPPYSLMKQFNAEDKRSRMALPYLEPLIHFALVYGTLSGPSLRCYSPGDIDQELMNAARNFLRSGGLIIDSNAKVVHTNKILKWFSADFGKNEEEILKHVSNYLDPADSTLLLDLLATSELKVIYQTYDWGLNSKC